MFDIARILASKFQNETDQNQNLVELSRRLLDWYTVIWERYMWVQTWFYLHN